LAAQPPPPRPLLLLVAADQGALAAPATVRAKGLGLPRPSKPPAKKRAGLRVAESWSAGGSRRTAQGSETRAAEALSFVQGQPGITIAELAAKMGIKQNYLYRVLPALETEKKVQKKGRGWFALGA
jgi:hypothetical protein